MISKLSLGASAGPIINYCMTSKEKKSSKKSRGKVLLTQYCYGTKNQLIKQFDNQSKINKRCLKSIWQTSISFHPDDHLDEATKIELSKDFAFKLGFTNHQILVIEHFEGNSHLHLIMNRVGLNAKNVVSTSHNYRKVAEIARELEIKYGLKQILSPRPFLKSEEQKKIPRQDKRKEQIKKDVEKALQSSLTIEQFKATLESQNYQVIKSRGISFIDPKKVVVKGSSIGFSLSKIETTILKNIKSYSLQINKNKNLEIWP